MIYSSTIFLNEFDLLDLKIAEESPHVDKIFITESPLTFTGNQKPLNFPIDKYKDNDKVVYLVTPKEMYKDAKVTWDREFAQRNYAQTLIPFNDDDVWFVTDMDEIICGDKMPELIAETRKHNFVGVCLNVLCYYINVLITNCIWEPPFAAIGKLCKQYSFQELRNRKLQSYHTMYNCGKHFSYLGGPQAIQYKLQNTSHIECGTPDHIKSDIENYKNIENNKATKIVDIDSSYPKTILDNLDKWEKHMYRRNK